MQDGKINQLIDKYLDGKATAAEAKAVEDWYASFEDMPGLTGQLGREETDAAMNQGFQSLLSTLKQKV